MIFDRLRRLLPGASPEAVPEDPRELPMSMQLTAQPFEVWHNGVYTFGVHAQAPEDYIVEVTLSGDRTGLYTFETLSDCYDWLETRGATFKETPPPQE